MSHRGGLITDDTLNPSMPFEVLLPLIH